MKKLLALLLCLAMVFTFAACGSDNSGDDEPEVTGYEIAMVTDVGQLMDGSFNPFTYEGCKQ